MKASVYHFNIRGKAFSPGTLAELCANPPPPPHRSADG